MAAGVSVWGGSNNMVASSGGTVSGGAFNQYTAPSATGQTYASLYAGVSAHALLPAGSSGSAYSNWKAKNTITKTPQFNNGNAYSMKVAYDGDVKAGVRKSSTQGMASSDAEVSAYTRADTVPNTLIGDAMITGSTTSSGTGETYSLASGSASYDVAQLNCPSGGCPKVEEVYGSVKGNTALESINKECIVCDCTPATPNGTKTGSAAIISASSATPTSSSSYSYLTTYLTSNRGVLKGTSEIIAKAKGSAEAGAWSGLTPITLTKKTGKNENVRTVASGELTGAANAYAAMDHAFEYNYLVSYAAQDDDYNLADNYAYTNASVSRVDANNPKTIASADSKIESASFSSISRDNSDSTTYSKESADVDLMRSTQEAKNTWSGYTSAYAELFALYDATVSPEVYQAAVYNDVTNVGPAMTGDKKDTSKSTEKLSDMTAKTQDGTDIASVSIQSKDITSFIDGKSKVGGTNSALVSTPKFSSNTANSVNGPTTTVSKTPYNNRAVIDFSAVATL